jgi:hypothetical protein
VRILEFVDKYCNKGMVFGEFVKEFGKERVDVGVVRDVLNREVDRLGEEGRVGDHGEFGKFGYS